MAALPGRPGDAHRCEVCGALPLLRFERQGDVQTSWSCEHAAHVVHVLNRMRRERVAWPDTQIMVTIPCAIPGEDGA